MSQVEFDKLMEQIAIADRMIIAVIGFIIFCALVLMLAGIK
jgi:hypothetical protein